MRFLTNKGVARQLLPVAAAAIAALVVAGCGGSSSGGGSGSSGTTGGVPPVGTATTSPAATGDASTVTWDLPNGEPISLDAIKDYDYSENTVLANMCESLLRQNQDFTLAPSLASSYTHPDPTTYVYKIRSGVKFWNGQPLTPSDVVYSLERNTNTKLGSYWAVPFYSEVRTITATAGNTVTVKLKQPDALFNRMMATAAGAIEEKSFVQKEGAKYGTPSVGPMCTGPFEFKSWTPGSDIVMTKNPNYWDKALQAHASTLNFKFITDESTLNSALISGEIDGSFSVPPAAISSLRSSGAGTVSFGATTEWFAWRMTPKKGALENVDIRKALLLATNRQQIAKTIFDGAATPASTIIQPAAWGYGKAVFRQAYDSLPAPKVNLAEAKKLVKAGGSPKQPIVVAVPAEQQYYVESAEELQQAASNIGLTVQIKQLPTAQFNALFYSKKLLEPYDLLAADEYGAGVADPIVSLSEFTPLSAYDYANYNNPAVTDNVANALKTDNSTKRAQYVVKAENALLSNVAVLPMVNPVNVTFINKKLTGETTSLAYLYYPWAAGIGTK
jgi:peptide/nickel transport system substrate-binding protein